MSFPACDSPARYVLRVLRDRGIHAQHTGHDHISDTGVKSRSVLYAGS